MKILSRLNPVWPLRLGLGLMYLYSGYDLFTYPHHWYGFVPQWFSRSVTSIVSIDTYLRLQGIGELAIGLLFLAWFAGRWGVRIAALLMTVEMALILLFVGVDPITFRDIGLLGAAAAMLVLSWQKEEREARNTHDAISFKEN